MNWFFNFPLDEGKGNSVKALSDHKHVGKFEGKPKWAKGKYGNAVSLSGANGGWVEVPDSPSLDITNEITLMCWVNPTQFTDEWFRILVKTWKGDTAPWMVYGFYEWGGSNGKTGFIVSVNKGKEGRAGSDAGDTPNLKPKKWTHLAATYDRTEMKFYYDGEVKAEQGIKGKIDTNDVPVSIGRNSEGNREHYIGLIDEVAIWKVALNKNEIQEAMKRVYAIEPRSKLSTSWGFVKNQYTEQPANQGAQQSRLRF